MDDIVDSVSIRKAVNLTMKRYPLIEMSAVNGFFRFDMIQPFSSDCLVNSFMNELKEHGIEYKLQNKTRLELPSIHLPWN
jgi:hypothetical protein